MGALQKKIGSLNKCNIVNIDVKIEELYHLHPWDGVGVCIRVGTLGGQSVVSVASNELSPHTWSLPALTDVMGATVLPLSLRQDKTLCNTGIETLVYETAKLRRSTRWRVYGFWGSILNLFPSLGIHFIKVRMVWTNFLGIHSVSKGRHRVDRLF